MFRCDEWRFGVKLSTRIRGESLFALVHFAVLLGENLLETHVLQDEENRMAANSENGIVSINSHQSVDQTVQKLQGILQAKGVKLFALIDHSGEAQKVGMAMHPTKLLIFGNPKAGTPLMFASPCIAIDLPLKILIWEDSNGKVWVSYNSPAYLQSRHGVPPELIQNIAVVEALAAKAAE